jgi:hypothetical protein
MKEEANMFPNMKWHFIPVVLLVLIAALVAPSLVFAGGWVVITLDQLPGEVIANQPYTIGMMARQHGQQPWQVEQLKIETRHAETGQTVSFFARPDKQPGHYQAELLFPEAGRWEWGIGSGMHPDLQPMPAIEVAADPKSASSTSSAAAPGRLRLPDQHKTLVGFLALLTFAAGTVLTARSRDKKFLFLAGVGSLVVCAGLVVYFFSAANAEARNTLPASQDASTASIGQKLFLAKGCVVCHTNDRAIKGSETYGVSMGPNLTMYRNAPDYLHAFLKDPSALKPATEMPDLELKLVEIEALIGFLNDQE